jgi:hypothetical protein
MGTRDRDRQQSSFASLREGCRAALCELALYEKVPTNHAFAFWPFPKLALYSVQQPERSLYVGQALCLRLRNSS